MNRFLQHEKNGGDKSLRNLSRPIRHEKNETLKPQNPETLKPLFTILIVLLLCSGCVKHTQLLYFRNQSEFVPLQNHHISNQVRIKIQTDDVLYILVKALDQETAEPFNLFPSAQMAAIGNSQNPTLQGYLVDPNGAIDFPVLGHIQISGLTIEEAKTLIAEKLSPYLKDPVIFIRFMNFRYTVLGEVKSPRTISVPGERITLLEAIGQAGDLTSYSNRENILVIREHNGNREFGYVDIQSPEVFQSPYFYLQQNDIIYVEPTPAKTADVRDPLSEALPVISTALSLVAVLLVFFR